VVSRWARALWLGVLAAAATFAAAVAGLSGLRPPAQMGWGAAAALAAGLLAFQQSLAPRVEWTRILQSPPEVGFGSLPALPRAFVDRRVPAARALAALRRRRGQAPTLVVTGLHGVGKTAFALLVAHLLRRTDYDDALFIQLGAEELVVKSADEVVEDILVALGASRTSLDPDPGSRRTALTNALTRRRPLLVLDDAVRADQLEGIRLPAGCAAVVTCDYELEAPLAEGAHPLRLQPLSWLASLRLLAWRIGWSRLLRSPRGTWRILKLCGGLPRKLTAVAGDLARAGHRNEVLADAARRLARQGVGNDVEDAVRASYLRLPDGERGLFQILGVLDATEVDPEVAAAALQAGPRTDEQVMGAAELLRSLVNAGLLEAAGPLVRRWRLHDSVRMVAREAAGTLSAAERLDAVERAVAVYLERVKTLRQLLTSEAARLNPELAALAQIEIDRQWANGTSAIDRTANEGLDLLAWLTGELVDLLFELADWPGLPSSATVVQALQRAARKRRDYALERRAHTWLEAGAYPTHLPSPRHSPRRRAHAADLQRRVHLCPQALSPHLASGMAASDTTAHPRLRNCHHRTAGGRCRVQRAATGHSGAGDGGQWNGPATGSRPALWSRTQSTSPGRTSTRAIRSSCTSTTARSPVLGPIAWAALLSPSRSCYRQVQSRPSRRSATVAVGSLAHEPNAGSCC
jgi:NB-ARC domain